MSPLNPISRFRDRVSPDRAEARARAEGRTDEEIADARRKAERRRKLLRAGAMSSGGSGGGG